MSSLDQTNSPFRTVGLTTLAMMAFAANSLLCRMALGQGLIDAGSFSAIRVFAGAICLLIVLAVAGKRPSISLSSWRPGVMLATYMVFFSFAYITLSAGTGALILFGAVQLTMFLVALRRGENFSVLSWLGLAVAAAGLIYLTLPGLSAPDPLGALLMAIAGIAWGFYSLAGQGQQDPTIATTVNFIWALPITAIVAIAMVSNLDVSPVGIALAVSSGALASGMGYVIWYMALPALSATRAATVQLSVPVIAAIGGILFLSEDLSLRLVLSSIAILGGIAIVLSQRNQS